MALYQVIAPDREKVVLCEGYVRHDLKHGSFVRSDNLVRMFPEFFVRILEPEEIKQQEVVTPEVITPGNIAPADFIPEPKPLYPNYTPPAPKEEVKPIIQDKKKAGRPRKG